MHAAGFENFLSTTSPVTIAPFYVMLNRFYASATAVVFLYALLSPTLFGADLPIAPDRTFSLVVIPDTQQYRPLESGSEQWGNSVFQSYTRWIADNLKQQNIVFVTHVGDIVDRKRVAAVAGRATMHGSLARTSSLWHLSRKSRHDGEWRLFVISAAFSEISFRGFCLVWRRVRSNGTEPNRCRSRRTMPIAFSCFRRRE